MKRELHQQQLEIQALENNEANLFPAPLDTPGLPDISAQLLSELCYQVLEDDAGYLQLEPSEVDKNFV